MDLRSCNEEELKEIAAALGEKPFRGKQLFEWVHGKQAVSIDEMTNLSQQFREKLKENYILKYIEF